MSARILQFKKLQAALSSRLPAQAMELQAGRLVIRAEDTAGFAVAMRAIAAQGLGADAEIDLTLEGFASVHSVDTHSCLCDVGAYVPLQVVEARLKTSNLTLGPLSPRVQHLRVGAWLEGPHASLRPIAGGRLEPAALAIEAALWNGETYRSHRSPRSAAGPDLDHLLLGGGGRLGRITRATLRTFPRPTTQTTRVFVMPSALAAARLLQRSLAHESVPSRATLWQLGSEFLLALRFEGLAFRVGRDAACATRIAKAEEMTERGPSESPEIHAPQEHEVAWSSLGEALAQMGGAVVELHRIARESVVVVSDRPIEGTGVVALGDLPATPPWFVPLAQDILEAR